MFRKKRGLIIKLESGQPDSFAIGRALEIINRDGVIAFPTDTVYGLGCRADSRKGVKNIYKLKGREFTKPLILFIHSPEELHKYSTNISSQAMKLINSYWPGPLTLIVKASEEIKKWKLDKAGNVGIRMPNEPNLLEIIKQAGVPLATTSANRSGWGDAFSPQEISESLSKPTDLLLDGGTIVRHKPSTVLDVSKDIPLIIRKGAVSLNAIQEKIGQKVKLQNVMVLFVCTGNTCRSPMAEGYLRHILPGGWEKTVTVRSCGTSAVAGIPAMNCAQQAAEANGFNLRHHVSTACTTDLLERADLIIAMEERHRQDVKRLVPDREVKLLAVDGVSDPIGGTLNDYLATLKLIKKEMPDIIQSIKELLYI